MRDDLPCVDCGTLDHLAPGHQTCDCGRPMERSHGARVWLGACPPCRRRARNLRRPALRRLSEHEQRSLAASRYGPFGTRPTIRGA